MNLQEKTLYHQIHPVKLLTDWITGFAAIYFLWMRQVVAALLIMFIPPMVVSFVLIRFVDLEKYKSSRFGKYVSRYMTRAIEAMRFAGYILMAFGGWFHLLWLILLGLAVILLAWLRWYVGAEKR